MITVNQERLVQEFLELVQIDSHSLKERKMAETLIAKLSPFGVEIHEDDTGTKVGGSTGNLICRLKGDPSKSAILFTSHMDTVQPGKGIKPQISEDRIISDGTTILGADDKAGVAGILEMVRQLREQNLPHGDIVLLFTIGEEIGLLGSRNLSQELLKDVKYGFAFDSGGPIGQIVIQGPSQAKLEVLIQGKTAHAGVNPEKGISAIKIASTAISRMKLGRIDAETTANIGMFHGGVATNIVPDRVEIKAEARSLDKDKLNTQLDHMKTTFEQVATEAGGSAEVNITHIYPAFKLEGNPIVSIVKTATRTLGIEASVVSSGGGSDANVLNGLGVPTVNLAIGYENIHTVNEFIRLNDLEMAAKLMVAITQTV